MKKNISIAILLVFVITLIFAKPFANSTAFAATSKDEQIRKLLTQIEKLEQGYNLSDPVKTANLYGKALQERNGALYLVAVSDENKEAHKDFIEESHFTIGVSSPWVDRYQVVSCKLNGEKDALVNLRLVWKTSSDETVENRILQLQKQADGCWLIISNAEPW